MYMYSKAYAVNDMCLFHLSKGSPYMLPTTTCMQILHPLHVVDLFTQITFQFILKSTCNHAHLWKINIYIFSWKTSLWTGIIIHVFLKTSRMPEGNYFWFSLYVFNIRSINGSWSDIDTGKSSKGRPVTVCVGRMGGFAHYMGKQEGRGGVTYNFSIFEENSWLIRAQTCTMIYISLVCIHFLIQLAVRCMIKRYLIFFVGP